MPAELVRKTEYPKTINGNYELISVVRDPYDGEVTLFYAMPQVTETITDTDSAQELVKKGVIIFDYEKIDNLGTRDANDKAAFLTASGNPVYLDRGLNGEYLVIEYASENTRLSVYGNDSVDLRELVRSLDL